MPRPGGHQLVGRSPFGSSQETYRAIQLGLSMAEHFAHRSNGSTP
jgi:hypothetical protein